jgi:hypothetical protein
VKTFPYACRFCGHFGRPDVDELGDWTCSHCGEPSECDACGGEIPDGHGDGCAEATS